jgi:hypothetical protein
VPSTSNTLGRSGRAGPAPGEEVVEGCNGGHHRSITVPTALLGYWRAERRLLAKQR